MERGGGAWKRVVGTLMGAHGARLGCGWRLGCDGHRGCPGSRLPLLQEGGREEAARVPQRGDEAELPMEALPPVSPLGEQLQVQRLQAVSAAAGQRPPAPVGLEHVLWEDLPRPRCWYVIYLSLYFSF